MRKIWLVLQREYLFNVKRKSFLFAAFGIPLFLIVVFAIIFFFIGQSDGPLEEAGTIGYIDQANVLTEAIEKPETFVLYASEEEAQQSLDAETIAAYFVVPENYMQNGLIRLVNNTTSPDVLKDGIEDFLLANLSVQVSTNIPLERVKEPVNMTVHVQDSGRTLQESAVVGLFLTPIIFSVVFVMASQLSSGFLMNGIVEEKTNRIMEILVTSVTPMQMLVGKIIGLGLLGLTQLTVWGVTAAIGLQFTDQVEFLSGIVIPPDLIIVSVIYFLLGYFLLASIMAGIGAVAGSEEESRQYAGIFSIILSIPFFAIVTFITDPNGTLPVLLTMIPFTAPLSMILRMSFGAVPLIQIVISIVILLFTTIFIAWLSAKIFRWGLLLYGKRLSIRELWRVIRQPMHSETVVATPQEGS